MNRRGFMGLILAAAAGPAIVRAASIMPVRPLDVVRFPACDPDATGKWLRYLWERHIPPGLDGYYRIHVHPTMIGHLRPRFLSPDDRDNYGIIVVDHIPKAEMLAVADTGPDLFTGKIGKWG